MTRIGLLRMKCWRLKPRCCPLVYIPTHTQKRREIVLSTIYTTPNAPRSHYFAVPPLYFINHPLNMHILTMHTIHSINICTSFVHRKQYNRPRTQSSPNFPLSQEQTKNLELRIYIHYTKTFNPIYHHETTGTSNISPSVSMVPGALWRRRQTCPPSPALAPLPPQGSWT